MSGLRAARDRLPARQRSRRQLVSGYLATDPPPGRGRMVGIDATHAWASVWTPQNQWGFDPTNDQLVDERYVVVGFGRDYADVPPCEASSTRTRKAARSTCPSTLRPSTEESFVRDFICPNCGQRLAFENRCVCRARAGSASRSRTWRCWSSPQAQRASTAGAVDASEYRLVRICMRPNAIGWSGWLRCAAVHVLRPDPHPALASRQARDGGVRAPRRGQSGGWIDRTGTS